jgi:uncharacterized membrane protein YeaQ/YmgE (transglycosylase-associated protein family)
MPVENPQILQLAELWANTILVWVGFGTIVGLLAKAIMPGKDPGGAVATLTMGVAGTIIGCAVLSYFWQGHLVSPISPLGFCVATGGALVVLLFFYKLLGGYYFKEDQGPLVTRKRLSIRRARQPATVVVDDEH